MEKQQMTAITPFSFKSGRDVWMGHFGEEDFHNSHYRSLAEINAEWIFCENGCMKTWQKQILQKLQEWNAFREYHELDKLDDCEFWDGFKEAANGLREKMGGHDISCDRAEWGLCESLFEQAREVKPGVEPPTFPAKLCHFIFPALFPVSDNEWVGIHNFSVYQDYWEYARGCWRHAATDRRCLMDTLSAEIKKSGSEPIDGYPFACKIAEFHVIGKGGYPACYREAKPE